MAMPIGSKRDDEMPSTPSSHHDDSDFKRSSTHLRSGREAFGKVIRSWASKKFMTGCVILLPIAITFYTTCWLIQFVDFFSPIYFHIGINIFGLGFVTSISFIFLVGVFMSSWLGASILRLGEWLIKQMPFIGHIYNASKQISSAISPVQAFQFNIVNCDTAWNVFVPRNQKTQAFKEVVIIRHPRLGEYAIGFITSTLVLQSYSVDEELCCVFIPTNHLYVGDIFLVSSKDVIRPSLSVREGIEIVVSGGMSMPQILSITQTENTQLNRSQSSRS